MVPSERTRPHISGARISGTFGIRKGFFHCGSALFGLGARNLGRFSSDLGSKSFQMKKNV